MAKIMQGGPIEVVLLNKQEAWAKACEYDGIDPNAVFVVFSDNNPYA